MKRLHAYRSATSLRSHLVLRSLVTLLVALLSSPTWAAHGALDLNFAGDGTLTTNVNGGFVTALVIQPADGKIVAGGFGSFFQSTAFVIARYLSNGTLDPTFCNGNPCFYFTQTSVNTQDRLADLLLLPDGKIAAVGWRSDSQGVAIRLQRSLSNGQRDVTFGINGEFVHRFGVDARGVALAREPLSGKLVVAVQFGTSGQEIWGVVRYQPNGFPDTTFGGDGFITDSFSLFPAVAADILVQPDGKIVVGGHTRVPAGSGSRPAFVFARYLTDGSNDPSFFGDGRRRVALLNARGEIPTIGTARSLVIEPDGRLVLGGDAFFPGGGTFTIVRLLPDGQRDFGFGNSGIVTTPQVAFGGAVLVRAPDGKLVAAGTHFANTGGGAFRLARYTNTGAPDSSFGPFPSNGFVDTAFAESTGATALALAVAPDGGLVAGGMAQVENKFRFALARYHGVAVGDQPDCGAATANPAELWPPDGRFVEVAIGGVRDQNGQLPLITIVDVDQSDQAAGLDVEGIGESTVQLRAARVGGGNGRTYTVTFTASAEQGHACTGTVTVLVPHDRGRP